MKMKRLVLIAWMILAITAMGMAGEARAQSKVDPGIPPYKPTISVSGNLNGVGSDTMVNLMTLWAEGFKKFHPNVKIQVEGKGSSTAPPALIEGTAQLGPMSRPMKSSEIDQFQKKYGFKPSHINAALDGIGVYVNKDNPIKELTMQQLDGIFSKTLKRGGSNIDTWGKLGLKDDWADRPISLYGRNAASGTYAFLKEHALANGDYKDTVKEQPGSASVVQGVTEDRYSIGYSGIGYLTSGVKTVAIANKTGQKALQPTPENIASGKYPISRYLYINFVKDPNKPMDPMVKEFLRFVLSKEGQEVVIKGGFIPLPAKVVEKELAKLS
jgi:phosphate transport system substrate-binding protein